MEQDISRYTSPSQINILFPSLIATPDAAMLCDAMGVTLNLWPGSTTCASISVSSGQLASNVLTVPVMPYYPDIFFAGYDCLTDGRALGSGVTPQPCGLASSNGNHPAASRGAITDVSGRLAYSANPATLGQYYTLWLTGVAFSAPTQPSPPATVLALIPAYKGSARWLTFTPSYVGVSPVFPGLIQVNVLLPIGLVIGTNLTDGTSLSPWPCGVHQWEVPIAIIQGGEPTTVGISLPVTAVGTCP